MADFVPSMFADDRPDEELDALISETQKPVPIAAGEWLAAHQPADLHVFERSGHCPMWEEPALEPGRRRPDRRALIERPLVVR